MDPVPEYRNRPTILVVDDTPDNLSLMGDLLKDEYRIKVANNGVKALRVARAENPPDLVLLDVNMPEMDGYEVCRQLKADKSTRGIPVIFLTARADVEDERYGLELGAVDYIAKPISPPIVLARVRTHLRLKEAADFLRDKNAFLEKEIERRTGEVRAIQEVTILALASLAETRDNDTGNHLRRTQLYVRSLASKLRNHPRFRDFLTDANIALLEKSAPLHDIGKVGIPDHILLKKGRLEPDEIEVMRTHTRIGWEAISQAERSLGASVEFLQVAKEMTLSHQEKWDGTGYPEGLSGDDIPVSARLMALADVYDALISRRVYHAPMAPEQVERVVVACRGTHFDPDVVDAFIELRDTFREIAGRYADASTNSDETGRGG